MNMPRSRLKSAKTYAVLYRSRSITHFCRAPRKAGRIFSTLADGVRCPRLRGVDNARRAPSLGEQQPRRPSAQGHHDPPAETTAMHVPRLTRVTHE